MRCSTPSSSTVGRAAQGGKVADSHADWSKKTYNNAISTIRCAFEYGYRDYHSVEVTLRMYAKWLD